MIVSAINNPIIFNESDTLRRAAQIAYNTNGNNRLIPQHTISNVKDGIQNLGYAAKIRVNNAVVRKASAGLTGNQYFKGRALNSRINYGLNQAATTVGSYLSSNANDASVGTFDFGDVALDIAKEAATYLSNFLKRKSSIEKLGINYGKEASILMAKINSIKNSNEYKEIVRNYNANPKNMKIKKAYKDINNTINRLNQEATNLINKGKQASIVNRTKINNLAKANAAQAAIEHRSDVDGFRKDYAQAEVARDRNNMKYVNNMRNFGYALNPMYGFA